MPRPKITNEEVSDYVSKYGYKLHGEYTHSLKKITLICPNNHTDSYLFVDFKRGKRCSECVKNQKDQDRILKFKSFVEANSKYKFIDLLGTRTIKLECDKGHTYSVEWYSFKKGHRCSKCSNNKKYSYEEVKNFIENEGYELLSDVYVNANTLLDIRCSNGHVYQTSFNPFRIGCRCQKCYLESNVGENSSGWKGGTTPLHCYLREYLKDWKQDSAKASNFRCVVTNEKFDVVHHLFSFSSILQETMDTLGFKFYQSISDYSEEEINLIKDMCVKLHYKHGLGVCLTNEVHREFHKQYGWTNNTPEQFEAFKEEYNGSLTEV